MTNHLLHAFLTDQVTQRRYQPTTLTGRRDTILRLERWLAPTTLADATTDQIQRFLNRGPQPKTTATELAHLRAFYRWATIAGHVHPNPCEPIARPRVPRGVPRPIGETTLAMALDLAPPGRIRGAILFAAWAGLRAKEISLLRRDDLWFHLDRPVIHIRDGKGGKPGAVSAAPQLVALLGSAGLPATGWLFPRLDGKPGPVKPHSISQSVNRYLHDMGITETLHQLRHRFGTQLLHAAGGNLRVAQEGLRHASVETTKLYTQIEATELAAAVARIPFPDPHPTLPFTAAPLPVGR